MSSSAQAFRPASARRSADLTAREPASTLAGLIDVLDRADGPRRPRPVHRTAARPAPLRSVQPAPSARAPRIPVAPVPRVVVVPERVRRPLGGLPGLVRRASMWGAGEHGEYLAWRAAAPAAAAPASASAPTAARRRGVLRTVVRRVALWGAGDCGQYLAWGVPGPGPSAPVRPALEPPVVLRELPSTASIRPVASSPAAALLPAGPASSPGSRTGTAATNATARPSPLPSSTEPPAWSPHVGRPPRDWPSSGRYGARSTPPSLPVRSSGAGSRVTVVPPLRSPRAPGPARTRGDPPPGTARGSPPPPRRTGPANGSPRPFSARAPSSHSGPAPPAAG